MSPQRLRSVTTQSGQINVEVDGVPYHSTYNPQREAQMFYRSHPVEEADVVLHFGWGSRVTGLRSCGSVSNPTPGSSFSSQTEELFKFSLAQVDNRTVLQDHLFRSLLVQESVSFSTIGAWTDVKKLTNSYG